MAVKKKLKKSVSKVRARAVVSPKKSVSIGKVVLWILGILLAVALLSVLYVSFTGNAVVPITGHATNPIQSAWEDYVKPSLEYILGWDVKGDSTNTYKFDDFFTMALLILLIVFSIVFVIVKSMPFFNDSAHSWSVWLISIAVSLLAVRFLTAEWLVTILLPYSTLGIAISAGLPFILFYFVVEKFNSDTLKRIAWIFFAVIFLYLWYDRTQTSNAIALAEGAYYGIYGWTALIAGIMALFGQKAVERVRKKVKKEKSDSEMTKARAQKEYNRWHEVQQNMKAIMDQNSPDSESYKKAEAEWKRVTQRLTELEQIILK